ncbi:hypothetical protein TNIN_14351, partial [Trichonephila inaurata madagascariensis]
KPNFQVTRTSSCPRTTHVMWWSDACGS